MPPREGGGDGEAGGGNVIWSRQTGRGFSLHYRVLCCVNWGILYLLFGASLL